MFKTAFSSFGQMNAPNHTQVIATKDIASKPELETTVVAVNAENPDYMNRKRYHYAEQTEAVMDDVH